MEAAGATVAIINTALAQGGDRKGKKINFNFSYSIFIQVSFKYEQFIDKFDI